MRLLACLVFGRIYTSLGLGAKPPKLWGFNITFTSGASNRIMFVYSIGTFPLDVSRSPGDGGGSLPAAATAF